MTDENIQQHKEDEWNKETMRAQKEKNDAHNSHENEVIKEKEYISECQKCGVNLFTEAKALDYETRETFGCGYKILCIDGIYLCPSCSIDLFWSLGKQKLNLKEGTMADDLSIREESGMEISGEEARSKLQSIAEFQKIVRSQMVEGKDFGIIPGTDKPTLLKPGAEKLAKLMGCADSYEIISETEDWNKPFFAYKVRCKLISVKIDKLISEGLGEANSYEPKWRYRWVFENGIPSHIDKNTLIKRTGVSKKTGNPYTQYRLPNEDVAGIVNTILKIAKKRALVDAALSAGRLSDLFTQDIEELAENKGEVIDIEANGEHKPEEQQPIISLTILQVREKKKDDVFNLMAIVKDTREYQNKKGDNIVEYHLSDLEDNKLLVSHYGKTLEGLKTGDTLLLKDVKVYEFKDKLTYLAKGIFKIGDKE